MTASTLPLAKEIDGFEFTGMPIHEGLVRDLAPVPSSPAVETGNDSWRFKNRG
jgi:hypothetical protein